MDTFLHNLYAHQPLRTETLHGNSVKNFRTCDPEFNYTGCGKSPAKAEYHPFGFRYEIETLHGEMVCKKNLGGHFDFSGADST
jgi:hypothetical protein